MILVVHPQSNITVYPALKSAFAMASALETRELVADAKLARFKYDLRDSYEDVTAVVYVLGASNAEEFSRVAAITEFAAQLSVPLVVLSGNSLLVDDKAGEFFRLTASHVESHVARHFIIGLVPADDRVVQVAAKMKGMFESGWFGRYHVSADPVSIIQISRNDVPRFLLPNPPDVDRARF